MTISAVCPVCSRPGNGLLCDGHYVNGRDQSCTGKLERDLGDVASIVADLDITMSRQDKVPSSGGAPSSPKGKEDDAGLSAIAHTRTPINFGAVQAADNLGNVLTTWARDVAPDLFESPYLLTPNEPLTSSARILLHNIDAIRRHPAVNEMVDEISDAIAQARRVVDRPADRIYLGQCMVPTHDEEGNDVTCWEEIYASPGAFETRCRVCGITHVVADRREWLMTQAEDRLFTVREAAQMVGNVGGRQITEDRIRGYLRRKRIVFHSAGLIRLGDLLAVVVGEGEKKSA